MADADDILADSRLPDDEEAEDDELALPRRDEDREKDEAEW